MIVDRTCRACATGHHEQCYRFSATNSTTGANDWWLPCACAVCKR